MSMFEDVDAVKPVLMVSNSELEQFKKCRRKWNLSSFNRRNLIPKQPNLKFWLGTGGHYALERYHGYGDDPVEVFRKWSSEERARIRQELAGRILPSFWEDFDECVRLGTNVLQHYLIHTKRNPVYDFKYIVTEYEFSVPIPNQRIYITDEYGDYLDWVVKEWGENPYENEQFQSFYVKRDLVEQLDVSEYGIVKTIPPLYVGRLDGLVLDENEQIRVIDHKFMAQLVDPETLVLDAQTARYVWAANMAIENGWWPEVPQGTTVRGALYNVVRKKVPKLPVILEKTGRTSKNKSIDTTYEIFRAALIERGEDPKDFTEVLWHLRDKGNNFFQLEKINRSDRELELVGAKLTYEYEDLARVASLTKDLNHPALYPTATRDCSWSCPFKSVCYAANAGMDTEFLIQEQMIHQKRTDLYATQLEQDLEEV